MTPQAPLPWEHRAQQIRPCCISGAEKCNVTRRVISIADQSDQRILLAVAVNLEIEQFSQSSRRPHALYRGHAERWMLALVMQDVSKLGFNLDPQHVSEQVFAKSGGQLGVLDLLTITKSKRLAILELKATENPELPLRAAAYSERIRRHQVQVDLSQYGYIANLQLQSAPPLLFLAAPAQRFTRQQRRC
jgi:hypothetical protein